MPASFSGRVRPPVSLEHGFGFVALGEAWNSGFPSGIGVMWMLPGHSPNPGRDGAPPREGCRRGSKSAEAPGSHHPGGDPGAPRV